MHVALSSLSTCMNCSVMSVVYKFDTCAGSRSCAGNKKNAKFIQVFVQLPDVDRGML